MARRLNEEDIDAKIADLLVKASEMKVLKKDTSIVKRVDTTTMPEVRRMVDKMTKDGYSTPQIAAALGYEESQIAILLEENTDSGSPENMLQTNLMRLHALVPLADATYRKDPNFRNAIAITGIIDSVTKTISEIHALKDKEDVYKVIIQKVVQPVVRNMISDMMTEFRFLSKKIAEEPETQEEALASAAMSIGKKFDENYRKATELLAGVIGLNAEAKARALASIALSGD
jgi:hypothetical protein